MCILTLYTNFFFFFENELCIQIDIRLYAHMFYAMLHEDNFILIVLSQEKKKKNSYSKFAFKLFRLNIVMFLKKIKYCTN